MLLEQPVTQAELHLADRQLEEFYCRIEDYYGRLIKFLVYNFY